jgi:predicted secreted protein
LILYRFFCSELPATDWQLSNQWPWSTFEGEFRLEVRVRDGLHAGPNETDDRRSEIFKINAPAIIEKFAEPHVDSWQKTFGGLQDDIGAAVLETSDGGYIMAGHTLSYGVGGMDLWMIKTDAKGNEIWSRTLGGKGDEFLTSVQQTSDDGYIMVGMTSSYGAGGMDLWMIKTDALGNKQWDKTFGGAWDDGGISVRQTKDGGFIATGATGSSGPSVVWLIKTDALGNELWDKTLDSEEDVGQMSTGSSVQQTDDGGYIVAGDSSKENILLIKTDSLGSKQWEKIFGGLQVDGTNVNANSRVLQTSDGGYIIDSYTSQNGFGGMDLWLIRTDAAGNEIWSKTFGGKGDDFGTAIQQTSDGGYIVAGHTSSYGAGGTDLWMIKTDAAGNEIWSRTFGGKGDDFGTAVQQTTDGSYIMTGRTSSYGAGGMDLWMIKTDANGSIEQDKKSQTHIFDSDYRI